MEWNEHEKNLSPLLWSLIWKKEEVATLLIKQKVKINPVMLFKTDSVGTNALILACRFGLTNIVIKYNKVTSVDNQGLNCLIYGSYCGHY